VTARRDSRYPGATEGAALASFCVTSDMGIEFRGGHDLRAIGDMQMQYSPL
jgi:hypothetical protein